MTDNNNTATMKAVAYKTAGPIDAEDVLQDIRLPKPTATGRDLLVQITAVSVNPIDCKIRRFNAFVGESDEYKVLGYDASGTVVGVGSEVKGFAVGDEVYYAGTVARPGTNSEFHVVDEQLVGRKPANISHAEAAALPATTITAWEMLFDRLDVNRPTVEGSKLILVIGGAGGVGSVAIQLLAALTDLTIIATASRPESEEWVKKLGAHHVVSHSEPLAPQVEALGLGAPGFVFATNNAGDHAAAAAELLAPQGRFGLIEFVDFSPSVFMRKSISIHYEVLFGRSLFSTPDVAEQGRILNDAADLVEAGTIISTATDTVGTINATNLIAAHKQLETGSTKGKVVLAGWD